MKWFTEHPRSVGETYWQHFVFAFKTGIIILLVGIILIIHAIFPALFTKFASTTVIDLYNRFEKRNKQ